MKGWLRLAIVLSVFWLVGCAVLLLVELSLLPQPRNCATHRPAFEVFFHSGKISAVHVRHPQMGILTFPDVMTRSEMEDAIRNNLPKFYEPTNAAVEWDVPVEEPEYYYAISFDGSRLLRIAFFPAVAFFAAVLVVGCGTRWVVQGFKT